MRFSLSTTVALILVVSGTNFAVSAPHKASLPKVHWDLFIHPSGDYSLSYPRGWDVRSQGDSVVFSSPGRDDIRASFGVIKRLYAQTTQDVLQKRLEAPDRPPDLKKMPARFAGLPAVSSPPEELWAGPSAVWEQPFLTACGGWYWSMHHPSASRTSPMGHQ